jgi:hypothetical protein
MPAIIRLFDSDARIVDTRLLDQAIGSGAYRNHAAFSPRVLARIQPGVAASMLTPKKIQTAFRKFAAAGLA